MTQTFDLSKEDRKRLPNLPTYCLWQHPENTNSFLSQMNSQEIIFKLVSYDLECAHFFGIQPNGTSSFRD